jgi:hypothetical protein
MNSSAKNLDALIAAFSKLSPSQQHLVFANVPLAPLAPRPQRLLSRVEAAKRIGYSRSWLHDFLVEHRNDIPEDLRPSRQSVSNRISVAFVDWFNLHGYKLPRKRCGKGGVDPMAGGSGETTPSAT